ncbi:MAG: putative transrane protein [Caulobacteraceae bacterium]|nr:putative transrane protein [Caulobacteraceae bacterium]
MAYGLTPRPGGIELGSRRVLHPGVLRWLRALGWMSLLFLAILLTEPGLPKTPGPAMVQAAAVMALTALAIYTVLVWLGEARRPSELSPLPGLIELPLGLLAGAAMFSAVMAAMVLGHVYDIRPTPVTEGWSSTAVSIQAGVIEELAVRAVILRLLWRAFGPGWALGLSAVLFGALHLANPNATLFAALCIALEAGVVLAGFYILTGRLWMSIGAHAAWNFTQGWVFGVPISGSDVHGGGPLVSVPHPGVSDLITGGAFGAEASAPSLVVMLLLGGVLMGWAWKTGRFTPADGPHAARDP